MLDLGNYLAGPYAPQMFADLGADVVKLEAVTGDPMRPGAWPFAGCQRGKRGLALDLKSPDSRPALEAAHQVGRHRPPQSAHARGPPPRIGLRVGQEDQPRRGVLPHELVRARLARVPIGPDTTSCSRPSAAGRVAGAGDGNPPMWHRFGFMDHQCAMSSAVATLLALYNRDRTGQAKAVAGSLLGAGRLDRQRDLQAVRRDPRSPPDASTPCRPACRRGGASSSSTTDGSRSPPTAPTSWPPSAAIELEGRKVDDALAILHGPGCPPSRCGPSSATRSSTDAANRAAKLVAEYQHAEWGKLEQPGALWYFGDQDVQLHLAPPALGEHTVEVLRVFGIEETAIEKLLAEGVAIQYQP